MATKPKEQEQNVVNVQMKELQTKKVTVAIEGITPYLQCGMTDGVTETYNRKKANRVTDEDKRLEEEKVEEKKHHALNGKIGIPSAAFHKGMIECAPYIEIDKKRVTGSISFLEQYIPITYEKETINKTWGISSGMTKAPRKIIRPEYQGWKCTLTMIINTNEVSPEQAINLLNHAGFHMGVGSWRREKRGIYGQYKVVV